MSVKIRLTRRGATNSPSYRLVAADTRSPRDGRFIEILGWYNPRAERDGFNLKMDRVEYWVGQGAQLSDTARSLVRKAGKMTVAEKAEPVAAKAEPVAVAVAEPAAAAEPTAEPVTEAVAEPS